jgi:DNA-binding MarR family transcriptional regulator
MFRHGHLFHHYWHHIQRQHFGHFFAYEEVLTRILAREPLAQSVLVAELAVKPATLSEQLSKLEKQKLIRREKSAQDKRESLIYLTLTGKKVAQKLKKNHERFTADFLEVLTPEEQGQLMAIMEKLQRGRGMGDHGHFSWHGRHWSGTAEKQSGTKKVGA